MNIKEWQKLCNEGCAPRKYDNLSREIQRSLKYNPDPNATVRHHLRDTEEQRKYNDEHYELWGFEIDENGNEHFEYGKYIIFVTKEEHAEIHAVSEETRTKLKENWLNPNYREKTIAGQKASFTEKRRLAISLRSKNRATNPEYISKLSVTTKNLWKTDEYRSKISAKHKQMWQDKDFRDKTVNAIRASRTDEFKQQQSKRMIEYYENNPVSEETKSKLSTVIKELWQNDEYREMMISARVYHKTDAWKEQCKRTSKVLVDSYKEYKARGGVLKWNDFQRYWKTHKSSPEN